MGDLTPIFSYDNDFRVKERKLNGADPIAYGFDADSLLISAGAMTLSRNTQNGLLTGTTLGQVADSLSYTGFGEVNDYTANINGTPAYAASYTRDPLGRITQKVETVQGMATTYDYAYDLAGRLVEVKQNGAVSAAYGYDANGNRVTLNGLPIAVYDDQDRLTVYNGTAYAYTANGELQSKTQASQTTQYRYDVLGNLRQATLPDGTQLDYLIDGRNRRIGKKRNGVLEQGFLYQDGLRPIAELDGNNQVVSRFVYADKGNVPSYLVKGGVTYRIVSDHLGSPRLVVNTADGTVAQRLEYDEWGRVLLDTNPGFQPFGFAGGIYDRDVGLVRFGARDYDPIAGRWTAKDPIRFGGGDANLYGYVVNDPIRYNDPRGLEVALPFPVTDAVGSATAGGLGTALGVLGGLLYPSPVGEGSDIVPPMDANFPPGYWPGDKGAEEWGRRNGCGAKEGKGRFHDIKKGDNMSKATDKYGVNPSTGEVIDPEGEVIGNLDNE